MDGPCGRTLTLRESVSRFFLMADGQYNGTVFLF
jgi:hypothetical protein